MDQIWVHGHTPLGEDVLMVGVHGQSATIVHCKNNSRYISHSHLLNKFVTI